MIYKRAAECVIPQLTLGGPFSVRVNPDKTYCVERSCGYTGKMETVFPSVTLLSSLFQSVPALPDDPTSDVYAVNTKEGTIFVGHDICPTFISSDGDVYPIRVLTSQHFSIDPLGHRAFEGEPYLTGIVVKEDQLVILSEFTELPHGIREGVLKNVANLIQLDSVRATIRDVKQSCEDDKFVSADYEGQVQVGYVPQYKRLFQRGLNPFAHVISEACPKDKGGWFDRVKGTQMDQPTLSTWPHRTYVRHKRKSRSTSPIEGRSTSPSSSVSMELTCDFNERRFYLMTSGGRKIEYDPIYQKDGSVYLIASRIVDNSLSRRSVYVHSNSRQSQEGKSAKLTVGVANDHVSGASHLVKQFGCLHVKPADQRFDDTIVGDIGEEWFTLETILSREVTWKDFAPLNRFEGIKDHITYDGFTHGDGVLFKDKAGLHYRYSTGDQVDYSVSKQTADGHTVWVADQSSRADAPIDPSIRVIFEKEGRVECARQVGIPSVLTGYQTTSGKAYVESDGAVIAADRYSTCKDGGRRFELYVDQCGDENRTLAVQWFDRSAVIRIKNDDLSKTSIIAFQTDMTHGAVLGSYRYVNTAYQVDVFKKGVDGQSDVLQGTLAIDDKGTTTYTKKLAGCAEVSLGKDGCPEYLTQSGKTVGYERCVSHVDGVSLFKAQSCPNMDEIPHDKRFIVLLQDGQSVFPLKITYGTGSKGACSSFVVNHTLCSIRNDQLVSGSSVHDDRTMDK